MQHVRLTDQVIWFKHIEGNTLLERLKALQAEEEIHLEVGGVVGRWKRMRGGADGRATDGIKPSGAMRDIWSEWYNSRRGVRLTVREVPEEDGDLSVTTLFPEWASAEDEAAPRRHFVRPTLQREQRGYNRGDDHHRKGNGLAE